MPPATFPIFRLLLRGSSVLHRGQGHRPLSRPAPRPLPREQTLCSGPRLYSPGRGLLLRAGLLKGPSWSLRVLRRDTGRDQSLGPRGPGQPRPEPPPPPEKFAAREGRRPERGGTRGPRGGHDPSHREEAPRKEARPGKPGPPLGRRVHFTISRSSFPESHLLVQTVGAGRTFGYFCLPF